MTTSAMTPLSMLMTDRGSQIQTPNNTYGSFLADDTDDHTLLVKGHGKSKLNVYISNPANQVATVKVYALHSATGAVGDIGTFYLGTFNVAAASADQSIAQGAMDSYDDPAPWYLIDIKYGSTPTDISPLTCTVYADTTAY